MSEDTRTTSRRVILDEASACAIERTFSDLLELAGWKRADPATACHWRHVSVIGSRSIRTAVIDSIRRTK